MTDFNKNTPVPQCVQTVVSKSSFLHGKAQKDFWEWYLLPDTLSHHKLSSQFKYSNGNAIKVCFLAMSITCQNAVILEWFDSKGYFISISKESDYVDTKVNGEWISGKYKSRIESTNETIAIVNELYNENFI
jgi:hypothetical protein